VTINIPTGPQVGGITKGWLGLVIETKSNVLKQLQINSKKPIISTNLKKYVL